MTPDTEQRLQVDPGRRTLGELLQEREAALHEIRKLRSRVEQLTRLATTAPLKPPVAKEPGPAMGRASPSLSPTAPHRAFPPGSLLRLSEVCELVGVGHSTIYSWQAEGRFPRSIRIGVRAVRWPIEAIEKWRSSLEH